VDAKVLAGGGTPTDATQTRVTLTTSGSDVVVTAVSGSSIQWVVGGSTKTLSSPQTITGGLSAAHATLDRIDLVIAKSDGTLAVTTGTPGNPATEPTAGTGQVRVGLIYVPSVASGASPSTGTGSAASGFTRVKATAGVPWLTINADDGLSFERSYPLVTEVTRQPDETIPGKQKIRVYERIDVGSGKLLGDTGSGAGDVSVGSGLSLSSGVLSASGGSSSPWTLLNTVTVSGVGTASLTIPSGYKHIMIVGENVYTTYITAYDPHWIGFVIRNEGGGGLMRGSPVVGTASPGNTDWMVAITDNSDGDSGHPLYFQFRMKIMNAGAATGKLVHVEGHNSGRGTWRGKYAAFTFQNQQYVGYVDLMGSIGNIYGTFRIYGTNEETI
jgi:hypothetical protein